MAVATARRAQEAPDRPYGVPAAFQKLQELPALAESRRRLLQALRDEPPAQGAVILAIESDIALTAAALQMANGVDSGYRRGVATIPRAVEVLTPAGVELLARRIPVMDFFEQLPGWEMSPDALRRHSVAVQRVADHLAADLHTEVRDEVRVAALLHDVGKLLMGVAFPGYGTEHDSSATPEERLRAERATLGLDHAAVGAVLVRRWGMPDRIADVVARHHLSSAEGPAAIVALANLLVHYNHGDGVSGRELVKAARAARLDDDGLRALMHELPGETGRRRTVEPCPLSKAELVALRGLARGETYKELAANLGRSASTIRTQLHSAYKKLGVRDRAQAVLLATDRGWLE